MTRVPALAVVALPLRGSMPHAQAGVCLGTFTHSLYLETYVLQYVDRRVRTPGGICTGLQPHN